MHRTETSSTGTTHIVHRYEESDSLVAITNCGMEIEVDSISDREEVDGVCGRCQ